MDILVCYKGSDFEKWGQQYQQKDPNNRRVVLVEASCQPSKIRAESLNAITGASRIAQNGRLILALGHGGGHATDTGKAMVDLGRKKAFRIQHWTLNYEKDERESDRKLVQLARPINNRCATITRKKRPNSHRLRENWNKCWNAREAGQRLDIRDKFEKIGKVLKSNQVKQVIFLSCNVGKGKAFLNKFGKQWGVKVTGYKNRIAIVQDSDDNYRVYFLKDSREGQGSNTELARTELPPLDQSYTSGTDPYQPGQSRIPISD